MSKLVSVRLDESSDFEIFFASRDATGARAYSLADDLVLRSTKTLSSALDMVRAVGKCASEKLGDLDMETVEATVGLKMTGKGQFVVAEAGVEASISVKFVLKKKH